MVTIMLLVVVVVVVMMMMLLLLLKKKNNIMLMCGDQMAIVAHGAFSGCHSYPDTMSG